MRQLVNKVYEPLFKNRTRYTVLMGGRGAGRSTVASQYALAKLIAPEYYRAAIMRYVLGDIRNSIYREIVDRAEENGVKESLDINDSLMSITYGANTINAVGFRKSSGDQKAKLKSLANYNCVIIEEADEIPEADFMQLDDSLRTIKGDIHIILLLNPPPKSHWINSKWFNLIPSGVKDFYIPVLKPEITDTTFIHTSFEDNIKNLSEASILNYRAYETTKPDHFYNMIRGLVPEVVRGKVYSNWQVIDSLPHEARLERYGLDFGYTNDPTAIVAVYKYNGGLILDEVCYRTGMVNREIADTLKASPFALTIADSAEPKSIDEIKAYGINILPADKGQGSINQGIQFVKGQRISVTKRSTNIIKEYENYAWVEDKEGVTLNVPKDMYNHACFPHGTIINGERIERVGFQTGIEDVFEYTVAGKSIRSTSNHPVLTQRGFVPIDTLRYNDLIWKEKLLFTKVLGGTDIPTVLTGLKGIIIAVVKRIVEVKIRDYIVSFGKKRTALSPKDFIFIILTATLPIIAWTIYSLFTALNTLVFIGIMRGVNGLERIYRKLSKGLVSGQRLKRVKPSELKWVKRMLPICISLGKKDSVICAGKSTHQKDIKGGGVTTIASRKRFVGHVPVYNLATKSGMYRVRGLLVSNCDAIRYAISSFKPNNEDVAVKQQFQFQLNTSRQDLNDTR